MKVIEQITENEMVAEFLRAEVSSQRWIAQLEDLLKKADIAKTVLENPNLQSDLENKQREWVLANFRGWKQNKLLFENFPEDVDWYKAVLDRQDINKLKYMNYSYWNELSEKTGLVIEGVKTAKSGKEIYNQSNDGFKNAASYLRQGGKFPKLILVAKDQDSDLILLEGHLRATAILWDKETVPQSLEVIVGFSKGIEDWNKD